MEPEKTWCEQCEQRVTVDEAARCRKRYCGPVTLPKTASLFDTRPIERKRKHYQRRKDPKEMGRLDMFADLLSRHDLETGDAGGDVAACALNMGWTREHGNAMLQRISRGVGRQAR
mgnify:CR=1 FL=1